MALAYIAKDISASHVISNAELSIEFCEHINYGE